MKTSATNRLKSRDEHSGTPIASRKMLMRCPPMKIRGRKTTTDVMVARATASPTSRTPRTAASRGARPRPRCRAMLSMTTTALSTSIPMPRVSPVIVSTLKDPPLKLS